MNLERKSKHPRAYLAKGENYLAMGDSGNALKQFGKLIQNYSDNPLADQARSFSAQALSEQLQFDDAQRC